VADTPPVPPSANLTSPFTPLTEYFNPSNVLLAEEIGRGTFGAVFTGIDKFTGEHYAVKRMSVDVDKDAARAYDEEIRVMKDLRHENIVQYIAYENVSLESTWNTWPEDLWDPWSSRWAASLTFFLRR